MMLDKENINYSLRNLRQRKGRSFLTVFSILIGIATIFIFISYGWGLYEYTESFTTASSADKVLVMAKGMSGTTGGDSSFALTKDDLSAVRKAAGVYEASGVYMQSAEISKSNELKYAYLMAYDPKKPLILDLFQAETEKGRLLRSGDSGVVLGYNYFVDDKIFPRAYELNDVIEVNGNKLKIIGFMESVGNPADDANIYMTNDKFEDLFPEKESYAQIIARVDISDVDRATDNIERNLRKERNLEKGKEDFFVQSFQEMIDSYKGAINIIIGFVILIALISVLVSGINTANTMITSVLERYKEIGVLKAIGARNSRIFTIFLFESAFLGLVAGVLGTLIGFSLSWLGGVILTSVGYGFLQPYFAWQLFVGCITFAVLTGAISGVIPAFNASKTNTVDALRYE
jgi:putative ABC transport system permease protein